MRIELLEEAEGDLLNGFAFYERQEAGLGQYFLDSVLSDIDSLQLYAGVHAVHGGYHRLLSKRFPYAIYYRWFHSSAVVRVYAVLDCRQAPERTGEQLARK